jgi:apolipoprotein N-acyltransferase
VVDGGARLITVQTNNATYGGTSQPAQQLGIERTRAIEFGRSVLVAATSGISATIQADGSIAQRLDQGEQGWLIAEVPLRGELTLASRFGHAIEVLLSVIALGAIILGASWSRVRGRKRIA